MPRKLSAEQIAGYGRDGYVCPVDAFSSEQARGWRERLEDFERAEGRKMTRGHNFKPHLLFPWVDEIVHAPEVLDAVEDLEARFGGLDLVLVESGGDNLTATFSRGLADQQIFVLDVSGGDKVPRKGGPGITQSDLLVINKTDLAPYVGADLGAMARDAAAMRGDGPTVFAQVVNGIPTIDNGIRAAVTNDGRLVQIGGAPLPGLAPVAKQQGAYVARVLRARLSGRPAPKPFRYRNWGTMATIGRGAAVADFGWLRLHGTLAWLLWGLIHISFLIGFRNRFIVFFDWLWSYVTFQSGARLITGPGSH